MKKNGRKENTEPGKDGPRPPFLDRRTYFLAKEWLLKVYRQPARMLGRGKPRG